MPPRRLVDYAKGICIVMVVMMHSVLGSSDAGQTGFMHGRHVRQSRSGCRISSDFRPVSRLVIDRDWRTYLDRKVVHFAYFYLLWVTIQFRFKAPSFAAETSWRHAGYLYLESFIEPFGTLWFIYLLPIFFVVTKLTRRIPPLAILPSPRCWRARMSHRLDRDRRVLRAFVYFYCRLLAGRPTCSRCRIARAASPCWRVAACAVGADQWRWSSSATANGRWSRWRSACRRRRHHRRSARCWRGCAGSNFLRYCGEHSLVIYLAFFLPMAFATLPAQSGCRDVGRCR
jgi:uncharacterized membrane protein YcfT